MKSCHLCVLDEDGNHDPCCLEPLIAMEVCTHYAQFIADQLGITIASYRGKDEILGFLAFKRKGGENDPPSIIYAKGKAISHVVIGAIKELNKYLSEEEVILLPPNQMHDIISRILEKRNDV